MLSAGLLWVTGSTALAAPSGYGLAVLGGGLSFPSEEGAAGLHMNPAAARPDHIELLLDLGVTGYGYGSQLVGSDAVSARGMGALPYFSAAIPLGPLGLGVTAMVPYARAGSSDPAAPTRYHGVSGSLVLAETDFSLAAALGPHVVVGGGLRLGWVRFSSFKSVDAAATINSLMGFDTQVPYSQPLLEGTQDIQNGEGETLGYSAGLLVNAGGMELGVSWRSAMESEVSADIHFVPSQDLQMTFSAELDGQLYFPPELNLGLRVPAGPADLLFEGGWVGWSMTSRSTQGIQGITLESPNRSTDELLSAYGISDPSLIGDKEIARVSGMKDVLFGGIGLEWKLRDALGFRTVATWYPAAVPDTYLYPGNQDFDTLDLRGLVTWRPRPGLLLALSADTLLSADREVENSLLRPTNDPRIAPPLPSGNGQYWMRMGRLGLSAKFVLGTPDLSAIRRGLVSRIGLGTKRNTAEQPSALGEGYLHRQVGDPAREPRNTEPEWTSRFD